MRKVEHLTMKQIEVLLKFYYLKSYTRVATNENLTPGKVKQIKENALRIIRLAYSQSYQKGIRFEGGNVLKHMPNAQAWKRRGYPQFLILIYQRVWRPTTRSIGDELEAKSLFPPLPSCWILYMVNSR